MNKKLPVRFFRNLGLMSIAFVMMAGTSFAAMDVYLAARKFTKTMPDNKAIAMWGFALAADGTCPGPTILEGPSAPGPRITVPPAEGTLNIHLCFHISAAIFKLICFKQLCQVLQVKIRFY